MNTPVQRRTDAGIGIKGVDQSYAPGQEIIPRKDFPAADPDTSETGCRRPYDRLRNHNKHRQILKTFHVIQEEISQRYHDQSTYQKTYGIRKASQNGMTSSR